MSIVDRGFKEFLYALDTKYKTVSRKTISKTLLPEWYVDSKINLIMTLKTDTNIAGTTDQWTSCANQGYTTVTAHFTTDKRVLESHREPKTAIYLAAELNVNGTFKDIMITDKVQAIVYDNAKNATNAADITSA